MVGFYKSVYEDAQNITSHYFASDDTLSGVESAGPSTEPENDLSKPAFSRDPYWESDKLSKVHSAWVETDTVVDPFMPTVDSHASPDVTPPFLTPPTSPVSLPASQPSFSSEQPILEEKSTPLRSAELVDDVYLDTIKASVATLLIEVINGQRIKDCYGCQTDHPSQTQHPCLYPAPQHYFYLNFKKLMNTLMTWKFPPALEIVLERSGIVVEIGRVFGAAEAFLHELRNTENILDRLNEIITEVIGEDETKVDLMSKLVSFWNEVKLVHTLF